MSSPLLEVAGYRVSPDHYIGGQRIASAHTFELRSPIDQRVLGRIGEGLPEHVDAAIRAAQKAFPAWSALTAAQRKPYLDRFADEIGKRADAFCELESNDAGVLLSRMRHGVVPRAMLNIRYFAEHALKLQEQPIDTEQAHHIVRHDPAGVVAIITPWNAPLMLATWKLGPALASGNTVVLKPPEWAPLTSSLLAECAHASGLPLGVFNVVQGPGAQTGAALVHDPRLSRISFTGSVPTAKSIAQAAGANLVPCSGGPVVDAHTLTHLPPVSPSKIIAVHISYRSRSFETRNTAKPTESPTYFTKPTTALNAHGGQIFKPADCKYLNYEGEYAVVISKTCRNVTPDEAWDSIEGFCPALDMGLQDFRDTDQGSMLRVKGADTLLPIGPGIVKGINLFEQTLRTYRNGLVVQEAHIGDETIWGPHYVIADIARHITLLAGDVILMGTPCHSRSVEPGDLIECEITGLGRLAGTVVAIPVPRASALGVGHQPTDSPEARRVALGCDERVPERFKDNYRAAAIQHNDTVTDQ